MKKGFTPIRSGFTLLELLIVVGIISLLVTLGTSIYSSAQRSSRDAKRKADLEEIRSALEMYRSENNQYPTTASLTITNDCNPNSGIGTYLTAIPEDPRCQIYKYYYSGSSSDYTVGAYLERGGTNCSGNPNCKNTGTQVCNYCLGPYGQK